MAHDQTLQPSRRAALRALIERYDPDNTSELLDIAIVRQLPLYAAYSHGPDGNWLSLHDGEGEALYYFERDDSSYQPRLLINLDNGREQEIEPQIIYRLAGSPLRQATTTSAARPSLGHDI